MGRSLKKQSTHVQESLGVILSTIDERLGGIRIIKAFNAEKKQLNKFEKQNEVLLKLKNRANRRRDMASPVSEVLGIIAVVCVLWYGGRLVLKDTFLDPGDFLAYIAIFSQLIQPLKSLSTASYNIKRGAASIERIESLIFVDEAIKEVENPIHLALFSDSIQFKNVGFAYGDKVILDGLNLTIKKGKMVALVGSSGAGKSTLADLVPRFHDVSSGEVLIDGVNIKQYSLESIRNNMGIVTQEPVLFNDTIANNIALGIDDVNEEQIIHAAKIANAHQYISGKKRRLPNKCRRQGKQIKWR